MKLSQFEVPQHLGSTGPQSLAFDVEMANSFPSAPPVICMIGLERYDPKHERCHSTIATITSREDELTLVEWFLDTLAEFRSRHPEPRLLTFSGTDNDLPWMAERIQRYGVAPERAQVLQQFQHVDLKIEFQRRTQHANISLKKLEERFGIEREATLSSKKVSYLLTDIVSKGDPHGAIPERVHAYLRDDIHHLLVIYDRWAEVSLEGLALSESEYLNQALSLLKLARKLQRPSSRAYGRHGLEGLVVFADALDKGLEQALARGSLESFAPPPLPPLPHKLPDADRLLRKHQSLSALQIADPISGGYRLARTLHKPKGVLAVVQHQGQLLMIKRAEHLERAPGLWGLPGGALEPDELVAQCAVRELREELHLEGRPGNLLGATTSLGGQFELLWMEVHVTDFSTLRPNPKEVAEARWVAPHELAELTPIFGNAAQSLQRFIGPMWGRAGHRTGRGPGAQARHAARPGR